MRKFLTFLIALAAIVFAHSANATSKFWNPYSVTGAVSGTGGVCRLTISPAIVGSGLTTANTVVVTSVGGATGCNVTAAISTVVDTTHIELTGTTFGGTYTSGGCVAGGNWTRTNTANWVSTTTTSTCGAGGAAIPGSTDIANFDANSLSGKVIGDSSLASTTISGLITSAFTGTLDFSVNNPSPFTITASGWTDAQTGAHTINMGSGTWTFSSLTGPGINITGTSGLTLNADTSTVSFAPSGTASATRTLILAANITLNTVTITGANQGGFQTAITPNGATIATLNLINGAMLSIPNGMTLNITNPFNVSGSATALSFIEGTGGGSAAIIKVNAAGASTLTGVAFAHVSFVGSANGISPTNSFDFGGNNFNGGLLSSPTFGSGGTNTQGIISAAP